MDMMKSFVSYIKDQNFFPGVLGVFINPFFFARRGLVKHIRFCAPVLNGKLLDVGCGKKPYKRIFANVNEYIGMDIEISGHDHAGEDIDVFYDGRSFPFADHAFDSVLCNQVFEHVFNPGQFMSEINRVLKPGGFFLITVPFVWDEHEQPYDFARYSSFGIKSVLRENGFEIINYYKSCQGIQVVFQLLILNIYKLFYSKSRVLNLLLTLMFISPFNLLGGLCSIVKQTDADLFLDNVVLARKV